MVRDLDYQFTLNENERGELYDLKKDPWQLHNVCQDDGYREIKKEYMDKMEKHMEETKDPALVWFRRIREFY